MPFVTCDHCRGFPVRSLGTPSHGLEGKGHEARHLGPQVTWAAELQGCHRQGALWRRSDQWHRSVTASEALVECVLPCRPKDAPAHWPGLLQDLLASSLLYAEVLAPKPVRELPSSPTACDPRSPSHSHPQRRPGGGPKKPSICCRGQTHQGGQQLTSKGSRRRRGDKRPAYTRPPSDSNSRCPRS